MPLLIPLQFPSAAWHPAAAVAVIIELVLVLVLRRNRFLFLFLSLGLLPQESSIAKSIRAAVSAPI